MANHDHSYKLLFSHREMVRDLLAGFVVQDWIGQLDYQTLEKVNGSYVSDDLRERRSDLIWRVRWGERWVYVYLLLEFQSAVERYMAVRILSYVGLLYQDLIRGGQVTRGRSLPPVLPIVLYSGTRRWEAAEDVASLIEPGPPGLEDYRPALRYLLIDQGRYADSELASLRNFVAALFRLEHVRDVEGLTSVLRSLQEWLRDTGQQSLTRAFGAWICAAILPGLPQSAPADDIHREADMAEVTERLRQWFAEYEHAHLEAVQKSRAESRAEGRQDGEAALLLRQLQKRFGDLPDEVRSRLQRASTQQLEHWGERLLEAETLEDLFRD